MSTFDEVIKQIEAAGFAWALEHHPGSDFKAVVEIEAEAEYIGDSLFYFPEHASTAEAALQAAFVKAREMRAEKAEPLK